MAAPADKAPTLTSHPPQPHGRAPPPVPKIPSGLGGETQSHDDVIDQRKDVLRGAALATAPPPMFQSGKNLLPDELLDEEEGGNPAVADLEELLPPLPQLRGHSAHATPLGANDGVAAKPAGDSLQNRGPTVRPKSFRDRNNHNPPTAS